MKNYTRGKGYENFVEEVYQTILEAQQRNGEIKPIKLERNKKIISKSGTSAEIDIYWEYEIAHIKINIAVECKNYNKNVGIQEIRDFARKISGTSGLKGVVVTKKGFSKNAVKEASADKIDLIQLREMTEEDWDGRIRIIECKLVQMSNPEIIEIIPKINKEWVKNNIKDTSRGLNLKAPSDKFFIEDKKDDFRYSLYELKAKNFFGNGNEGEQCWGKKFEDGWITTEDMRVKIDELKIIYSIAPLITTSFTIDFKDSVLAIMDYINGDNIGKGSVLKSGETKRI